MEFVTNGVGAVPGFDPQSGLRATGGDPHLLRELARLFLCEYPALIGDLRSAVTRGDAAAISFSAHALKGCASHFGATSLVAAALRLEQQGRSGDLLEIETRLAEFEAGLHPLVHELQAFLAASLPT